MSDITVRTLIDKLEELAQTAGDDAPVRLATQPTYPFQHHVSRDLALRTAGVPGSGARKMIYILEAGQVYEMPYAPAGIFTEGGLEDPAEPHEPRLDGSGVCLECGCRPEPDDELHLQAA